MTYGVTSRNHVDHMFESNSRIDKGSRTQKDEPKGCTTQFKTTVIACTILGGAVGSAIPPYGAWTIPGMVIGAGIGIKIASACDD